MSLEERRRLQQEAIDADDGAWERDLDAQNRAKAGIEVEENSLTNPADSSIMDTGGGGVDDSSEVEQRLNTFENVNERNIAKYLENIGRFTVSNDLQGVPGEGRQGDAFVDGVKTEFKTLNSKATPNTIKNDVNTSIKYGGQARNFVIDARNTSLTKEEAEQGVFKALGISRGKVDYIEIIGKDYFFGYAPRTSNREG